MVLAAIGGMAWVAAGVVLAGCVVLPPVILRAELAVRYALGGARDWRSRLLRGYRRAGVFAWMFAWFKTRLDPMFKELPERVVGEPAVREVLDVGCGYGCAGCAVLEWVEGARVYGVDPNPKRVRAAGAAFGERGRAVVGAAPDFEFPAEPARFDVVLLLDMIHFVSDEGLARTLGRVHERMETGGRLILRANMPAEGRGSWKRRFAMWSRGVTGVQVHFRTVEEIGAAMMGAGFKLVQTELSGGNVELRWFTARA